MNAKDLKVGRAYFACAYYLKQRPVPEIETWIYIGKNISEGDSESGDIYHYFQDPESYFFEEMLAELPQDQADEYEKPESPVRMRILEDEVEGFVQNLGELESFVTSLSGEPNADESF